jgi:hypothetical protein
MSDRPILVVDFDGVLNSYASGWQGADIINDPPVEGAIEWLYRVIGAFEVHIYSSRSKEPIGITAMKNWLYAEERHYRAQADQAGKHLPKTSLALNLKWPTEKPAAFLSIDDRCIRFEGPGSWPSVDALKDFKPWHARKTGS